MKDVKVMGILLTKSCVFRDRRDRIQCRKSIFSVTVLAKDYLDHGWRIL